MKKTLKVKGMHCKSCDMLVEDSLSELKGVNHSKSNHETGLVEVVYDENEVSLDQIKKSIVEEGFEIL